MYPQRLRHMAVYFDGWREMIDPSRHTPDKAYVQQSPTRLIDGHLHRRFCMFIPIRPYANTAFGLWIPPGTYMQYL